MPRISTRFIFDWPVDPTTGQRDKTASVSQRVCNFDLRSPLALKSGSKAESAPQTAVLPERESRDGQTSDAEAPAIGGDAVVQPPQVELNATQHELAVYLLECAAVGETVTDPGDLRRLRDLSASMEETHGRLWRGRSNDREDLERSEGETHFRGEVALGMFLRERQGMLAQSAASESSGPPTLGEAASRELGATLATVGELVEAGPCAVQASLTAFLHADHLAHGEQISFVGLIDGDHAYTELTPSPQEQQQAAAEGAPSRSVVGDPWMRGSARLTPHTRHGLLQETQIARNYTISHSGRGDAAAQIATKRMQVQTFIAPILDSEIQRMRIEVPEPQIHPMSGASIGDPAFDRRALEAIRARRPASRERLAQQAVTSVLGPDAAGPSGVVEAAWKVLSDADARVIPPEVPGDGA